MKGRVGAAWACLTAGALVAAPMESARVAILRVGASGGPEGERAHALLQARLRVALENLPFPVHVVRESYPIDGEALGRERAGQALRQKALEVLASAFARDSVPLPLEELRRGREELGAYLGQGPAVSLALAAEAAQKGLRGDWGDADRLLSQASVLHPDGAIDLELEERTAQNDTLLAAVEGRAAAVESAAGKACTVRLRVQPDDAKVAVNGFAFFERREFRVPVGRPYHFEVAAGAHSMAAHTFRCDRGGTYPLDFELSSVSGAGMASGSFGALFAVHDLAAILVVEARDGVFQLRWHGPNGEMEPIGLSVALNMENILRDPARFDVVLPSDQARRWLSKGPPPGKEATPASLVLPRGRRMESSETRWYNDRTLWAIAGGLALGSLLLITSTRESDLKGPEESRGIPITWE